MKEKDKNKCLRDEIKAREQQRRGDIVSGYYSPSDNTSEGLLLEQWLTGGGDLRLWKAKPQLRGSPGGWQDRRKMDILPVWSEKPCLWRR